MHGPGPDGTRQDEWVTGIGLYTEVGLMQEVACRFPWIQRLIFKDLFTESKVYLTEAEVLEREGSNA